MSKKFPRFVIYKVPKVVISDFTYPWQIIHYYENYAQAIDFSTGFSTVQECWDFVNRQINGSN